MKRLQPDRAGYCRQHWSREENPSLWRRVEGLGFRGPLTPCRIPCLDPAHDAILAVGVDAGHHHLGFRVWPVSLTWGKRVSEYTVVRNSTPNHSGNYRDLVVQLIPKPYSNFLLVNRISAPQLYYAAVYYSCILPNSYSDFTKYIVR